jgi:protease IV
VARRRAVTIVLVLVGLVMLLFVGGAASLFLVATRGPSVPNRAALVLRPGGQLLDARPDDVVDQVLGRDVSTLGSFLDALRKARRDERISAIVLRPSSIESPFWGKVQELRDAVFEFRRSGKKAIAYLEYGGDREYYLASAADQVFLLPTSPLDLTGLASYEIFLRGAFDKVGAYPDFLQIGAYKTAPNQLTQRGFTRAHREMLESLNEDLYDQIVRGIADVRHKSVADIRALIDDGPFAPEAAQRAGLVDGLAYFDQIDDRVPALKPRPGEQTFVEGSTYQRIDARAAGIRPRSRIAVLYAAGVIASGRSTFDPVNGAIIGSDTMVEQIQRIRDDDSIRAVVLRVDSPGGSSVASDVIWRELMISRDAKPSRPLVASMSDLAASGGYYISMPAHAIVAQPGTLTGSIGVFGGKIALGGTLDKLGISTETVASGKNATIESPFTPFTPEQRKKLMAYMESFYADFVRKAATARRTTPERIDAIAQGRVWTGRQARQLGLVDALGGLDAAVAMAKQRAGIPADEDVELVVYPPRRGLFEVLAEQFGSVQSSVWIPVGQLAADADRRALSALTLPMRLFRRGEPLALMPYVFVK